MHVTSSDSNNFINNSAATDVAVDGGGEMCTSDNTILRFNGTRNFVNNSTYYDAIFHHILTS